MNQIIEEVLAEREKQKAKWGEQNHPSVDAILTDRQGGCTAERMAEEYEVPTAYRARFKCDSAHRNEECTYAHIAVEELSEAIEAATLDYPDETALRAELIQLAAVAVAWIEAIDRRVSV